MAAHITLTIANGPFEGTEYAFDETCRCVIGRANDCVIQMPTDFLHAEVSRHHCLLEIDPPTVRVRDLDSLNGTFVNGDKIGQRLDRRCNPDGSARALPPRGLKDGDELGVGGLIFRVGVTADAEIENEYSTPATV
jgi:pSer/pThr/pTyr-binding forkhead associated (FHA) protein